MYSQKTAQAREYGKYFNYKEKPSNEFFLSRPSKKHEFSFALEFCMHSHIVTNCGPFVSTLKSEVPHVQSEKPSISRFGPFRWFQLLSKLIL